MVYVNEIKDHSVILTYSKYFGLGGLQITLKMKLGHSNPPYNMQQFDEKFIWLYLNSIVFLSFTNILGTCANSDTD